MGTMHSEGSIGKGIFWMFLLSTLLFWFPLFGGLIAGIVGGKKSGGIGNAFAAVFLPVIVLVFILFSLGSGLTGLPIIGAIIGGSIGVAALVGIGPLLLGAVIGGAMAPKEPSLNHYNSRNSITGSTMNKEYDLTRPSNYSSDSQYTSYESDENTIKSDIELFKTPQGDNTIIINDGYTNNKQLPGSIVVLNGVQANKKLNLYGFETERGTVITIGRDSPDWKLRVPQSAWGSHLRIADSSNTLSRLQAEFIYIEGNMYIKNKGSINPTRVNGRILPYDSWVLITNNSRIQAGFLEMHYVC
jgi:hypothetical protein